MRFNNLTHERMLDRGEKRALPEYWSARSTTGMVTTAHYLATRAGTEALAAGGNAFDAAARSNAAPTMAYRDGRPWLSMGSTGSERMASSIFQVLTRLARQDPFDAVHAPRLHCTPESQVFVEADRYAPACLHALTRAGFSVKRVDPYSFKMGGLQPVLRRGRSFHGVGEPRRDGAAAGPEAHDGFEA